jgi:hypothetical protein
MRLMIPTMLLLACPEPESGGSGPGSIMAGDSGLACPDDVICLENLPYFGVHDTTESESRGLDAYACAPDTDESGPEIIFQVMLEERSWLGMAIDDSGEGIDIDAHLLSDLDSESCEERGNYDAGALLDPGIYYLVADTYVSSGSEQSGEFSIAIDALPVSSGDCSMESGWMDRVGDGGEALEMPATGPIVMEAHLVTIDDGYGSSSSDTWPQSITESIDSHYALSQDSTGMVMHRSQSWAPQEGCEYGQGSYGHKLPVEDEAWYVNMYWSDRPDPGTRMILQGTDGRAVVVASGYETGPGNLDHIGGTTEEVHRYLGTGHGSTLTLGFAVDQDLPLGPVDGW